MRYNVDGVVYGIHFDIAGADGLDKTFARLPYMFGKDDAVEKIQIIKLTVKEHHKVRWDYDEDNAEPKYDGFLLEDEKGRRWSNQYPTASYEQLSDSADRQFQIYTEGKENWDKLFEEHAANGDPVEYYLLTNIVRSISQGIKFHTNEKNGDKRNPSLAKKLIELKEKIFDQFKQEFNLTMKEEPTELPGYTHFVVSEL